jgi:hypothetical protein
MNMFSCGNEEIQSEGYADGNEMLIENVRFSAVAAFTLLGPTMLFCIVFGQFGLFYLVAGSQTVGAAIGVMKFRKSLNHFLSCIPLTFVPRGTTTAEWKKAA